ncbi:unnamed protein product [Dicrocoelium dendriticum]|nr:unnamed protein product [Dicrocoelium dendriticum]
MKLSRVTFCVDGFLGQGDSNYYLPIISDCLQHSFFLLPLIYLIISIPFLLWYCHVRESIPITRIDFGLRFLLQYFLSGCVLLSVVSLLCCVILKDALFPTATVDIIRYIALIGNIISLISYLLLSERLRRLHQPRSQFLFSFTLILFVSGIPRFYGLVALPMDDKIAAFIPTLWVTPQVSVNLTQVQAYASATYLCAAFGLFLTHFFSPHYSTCSLLTDKNPCPELWASVPALWTYTWVFSTIWSAFRNRLNNLGDLFSIRSDDAVEPNFRKFQMAWDMYSGRANLKRPHDGHQVSCESRPFTFPEDEMRLLGDGDSTLLEERTVVVYPARASCTWVLIKTLWTAFSCRLLSSWTLITVGTILNYASPVFLGYLLRFLSSPEMPIWQGYLIAFGMFTFGIVAIICDQRGFYGCCTLGIAVRSALTSAIYRKGLYLSSESRSQFSSGEQVNLLSVDVNRILEFFLSSSLGWTAIIQFCLSFYLLWGQLDVATLAGLVCLLLMLPSGLGFMWVTQKFEAEEMEWKDARMRCLGELFAAAKIVKLYAWEKAFQTKANSLRDQELKRLFRVTMGWIVGEMVWSIAPVLILLSTFIAFCWELIFWDGDGPHASNSSVPRMLNSERIFVSVSLFNLLRIPLILLPWSLSAAAMAYVSLKRISAFLTCHEVDRNPIDQCENNDPDISILFKDASFSWTSDGPLVLHDVNLTIRRGWLVIVLGAVGSGKSSLLSACLGDLVRRRGSVCVSGSVAYVSQTTWLQSQSLQENICFGDSFDEDTILPRTTILSASERRAWYRTVLSACALLHDIQYLPAGDLSGVGERGVILSGGQRQRVGLARAVYQDADIYLLDDPLSAVDSGVAQHLFAHIIGPCGLLGHKTRLMTTNSLQWLPQADWIVVLSQSGEVIQSGTYQDLMNDTTVPFSEYLRPTGKFERHSNRGSSSSEGSCTSAPCEDATQYISTSPNRASSGARSASCETVDSGTNHAASGLSLMYPKVRYRGQLIFSKHSTSRPKLISSGECSRSDYRNSADLLHASSAASSPNTNYFMPDEDIFRGRVSLAAYAYYFRAKGWASSFLTLISLFITLGVAIFGNFWLQLFADDPDLLAADHALHNASILNDTTVRTRFIHQAASKTWYYLVGYIGVGVALFFLTFSYSTCHFFSSIKASKVMHRDLLSRVLRAPVGFFDQTPLGRILNRFSNDTECLDHDVPYTLLEVVGSFSSTIVALLIILFTLRPFGLGTAIILPAAGIYLGLLWMYVPCSRQARRLDALTRSPLLAHFSETSASLLGASVIRAFNRTGAFIANVDKLIDENAVCAYLRYTVNRWLDVYLKLIDRVMLLLVTIVVVYNRTMLTPGLAGLVVIYAMDAAENFSVFVKQLAEFETSAVSLERIWEYTLIEQEAPWDGDLNGSLPADWPAPCCHLLFNKATVMYKPVARLEHTPPLDGPLPHSEPNRCNEPHTITALRSIDLSLSGDPGRRRIGIVGRTGAGKSSLASSLFRLVEPTILPEDYENLPASLTNCGPIMVDGIDLCRLGLHEIRSRFSILPQEPVLFSGSLRFNLDPFGDRTDDELWSALDAAHLRDWLQLEGLTLEFDCGEAGCNLSAGQCQLICLARVFLSSRGRVRLLVLDEATAAMDPATADLVMRTVVGDQFRHATVIIIAHRLSTVLDTDFIVVLDQGMVVETGHPMELLADPNSRFSSMHRTR